MPERRRRSDGRTAPTPLRRDSVSRARDRRPSLRSQVSGPVPSAHLPVPSAWTSALSAHLPALSVHFPVPSAVSQAPSAVSRWPSAVSRWPSRRRRPGRRRRPPRGGARGRPPPVRVHGRRSIVRCGSPRPTQPDAQAPRGWSCPGSWPGRAHEVCWEILPPLLTLRSRQPATRCRSLSLLEPPGASG